MLHTVQARAIDLAWRIETPVSRQLQPLRGGPEADVT